MKPAPTPQERGDPPRKPRPTKWYRPALLGICAAALLAHVAILGDYLAHNPAAHAPISDGGVYWRMAGRIAAGQWLLHDASLLWESLDPVDEMRLCAHAQYKTPARPAAPPLKRSLDLRRAPPLLIGANAPGPQSPRGKTCPVKKTISRASPGPGS